MKIVGRYCTIFVVSFMLIACGSVFAQVTSVIQGRVTDASGAVIPGASVRVTNIATGTGRTGQSAADGYYRVPDLLAGNYELRVEQPGFKTLVRKGIELNAQATLQIDATLEVGAVEQTVEVSAEASQIETTESRISEVVSSKQIESLPAIGRGIIWLTAVTPGISGKAEEGRMGQCCDSLQSLASPNLSSGGSELKAAFFVDGVAMHYGDGASWNLAFTPNPDAVEEMRVSTNPTSAEEGILSGVQVQMVTKSGTNSFHGTGHYTFLDDSFNALPYGSSASDVGPWYQRFFGGTLGGPVIKDRLFFFGAYEGLREQRAAPGGSDVVVETQAFKDWVTQTRPNSVAAKLMASDPPFKYASRNLVDLNGDGIMDIGTVSMDRPSDRQGNQFNGRADYQSKSAKDRIYFSFWRTRNDQSQLDARPTMDYAQKTGADLVSLAYVRTVAGSALNEFRFSRMHGPNWDWRFKKDRYNVPCIQTEDGISFPSTFSGACSYSYEVQDSHIYSVQDTLSWNRGAQSWKFGGSWRRVYATDPAYLYGDIPAYTFATAIDFANDNPYVETRSVDAATGQLRDPFVEFRNSQLALFAQNSWQVRHGLTLNLGLRWDYYAPHKLDGLSKARSTYGPSFANDQVNPGSMGTMANKPVATDYSKDLNNISPRVSVAWDPKGKGKDVIRAGFFILHDEINSLGLYRSFYGNPPISSTINAGPDYGIPIVYGIAPEGSRDFPVNPAMVGPEIDSAWGVFAGTRPGITGYSDDFATPTVYDINVAYQRQVFTNLAATVAYHHRRTTNDLFSYNANRVSGDLLDGVLDRINPHYGGMTLNYNGGKRSYDGLVLELSKRLSRGWQLTGSYGYNNSRSNYGGVTEVFHPELDWARDESATHTFKANAVWDLPVFAGRHDIVGGIFGGWQLSGILNLESGPYFNPTTGSAYGAGGDFNADGQRSDRPDRPTSNVPTGFSKSEWMTGAMSASIFPLPNVGDIRNGTLARNYFHRPGYSRIDASFAKKFRIGERLTLQYQLQASNMLNHLNISGASSSLASSSFARASSFYPMRAVQMSFKAIF